MPHRGSGEHTFCYTTSQVLCCEGRLVCARVAPAVGVLVARVANSLRELVSELAQSSLVLAAVGAYHLGGKKEKGVWVCGSM